MTDDLDLEDVKKLILEAYEDDTAAHPLDDCIRELIRIEKKALYEDQTRGKLKNIGSAINRHYLQMSNKKENYENN
jgi:hypothetical protein